MKIIAVSFFMLLSKLLSMYLKLSFKVLENKLSIILLFETKLTQKLYNRF